MNGDIVELSEDGRKLFGTISNLAPKYKVVGFCNGAFMASRNQQYFPQYYDTYLWILKDYITVIGNVFNNLELLED